ncbi:uncharacterized protein MAM_05605 [Metarhizium album ARSEF 1941]|uniref:Uncharacterized protein n=1 Tax=Metarhizium album (strain ARSEF 1941) TaxID=1081103 RepID=A0A0B2WT35_METAS|nr:uncharacterized protein MAM_05605 [Metarhizium album ARSEF 1941]KHN96662.1 hypothetical protein MAM_05605 [Metarhizium album ARSEF 1941]
MVLLGNLVRALSLNPPPGLGSDDNEALVRAESTRPHDRYVQGIPSYATNIKRFHYTVKRARSIIEERDAVAVPHSEVDSILTKLKDLETQVKAWESQNSGSASKPTSDKHGSGSTADEDCDAENLMYDLGARAAVNDDGRVSGHPLFRRDAPCRMESALSGESSSKSAGSSDLTKGSSAQGGAAPNRGGNKANPNSSPSTGNAASNRPQSEVSAGQARTGLTRVVPATVESVEVKTLPVNGNFVTTTITRTTTVSSTVTAVQRNKATGSAQEATPDDSGRVTEEPQASNSGTIDKGKVSHNVPAAPSSGSFAQFSNDTAKFSNGTAAGHNSQVAHQRPAASVAVDDKSLNHTSVEKTEPSQLVDEKTVQETGTAGDPTAASQESVSVAPDESANDNTTADTVATAPGDQTTTLDVTTDPGPGDDDTGAETAEESLNSVPEQEADSSPETSSPSEKIQVVTVVPIAAESASAPAAMATPAVTRGLAAEMAEPATSVETGASEAAPRVRAGFVTVLVPESK